MIRRRTYRSAVKTAQIGAMHRCIDASIASLQPDNVAPVCPMCREHVLEGEGLPEERPEYASSWQALVYCSEACKALRPAMRL